MSNITKHESAAVANVVEEKTLIEYLDTMGLAKTAPDSVKKMFLQVCKAFQLNPFKRQAYLVGYGQEHKNWSVITGFEQYINRANATERLDGWKVDIAGNLEENSLRAKITIWRKDFSHPFEWEAWYYECVATDRNGNPTHIWKQRPTHMIKKVAIAQGFRLCFPEALEGMPYTGDEMGETIDIQYQEEKPKPKKEAKPVGPTEEEMAAAKEHEDNKLKLSELLNNPNVTTEEKAKMLGNMDSLTPERLLKAMDKLKATIAEREKQEIKTEDAQVVDEKPQSTIQEDPITKEQKGILLKLLNAPEVKNEERTSVSEKMEGYGKPQAEKEIKNWMATIKERKTQTA